MTDDRLLDANQLAAYLGCHVKSVYSSATLRAIARPLQLGDDPRRQPRLRWLASEALEAVAPKASCESGNAPDAPEPAPAPARRPGRPRRQHAVPEPVPDDERRTTT